MREAPPSCWPTRRLGDLLARPLAYGVLKPGEYTEGGVPLVRIQDVHTGYLDATRMHKISPSLHAEFRRTALLGGELLLSIVGTLGKVVEVPGTLSGANISRALCVLGPSTEINRRFFFYVLNSQRVQDWIAQEGRGNAQAVLNLSLLRELIVQVPPLQEQRRIAAILSTVDEAIECTQAVIDQLQVIKKAMMAELLTRGLPGRHTRFKQTESGEVPESWDVVPLGSLIGSGPDNGLYKPQADYGNGAPIVRIDTFNNGDTISGNELRRVNASPSDIEQFALHADDILVNRVNSLSHIAKAAIVGQLPEPTVFESNMMRFSVNQARILPTYAFRVVASAPAKAFFVGRAKQAVAQASVNQKDVCALPVPLPALGEQVAISDAIGALEDRLSKEQSYLRGLFDTKSALMSVLLTGELRVKPDKEPL